MGSCIFTFYISESNVLIKELTNRYRFGKYNIFTDSQTPYHSFCDENRECAIFGLAVNVLTRKSMDLVNDIISSCSGINDVITFEKNLGGKYIILYRKEEQYYIFGDATCSIPIYYNIDKEFACTSNSQYLVKRYGYLPDSEYQKIRKSGDISQAMPYDITQYREVKQLIPNHYLSINQNKAKRFINSFDVQSVITIREATERVIPMIDTICDYYKSLFKIYCPITGGRDSRVVQAFLEEKRGLVPCYTIYHSDFNDNEENLVIPKQVCLLNNLAYEQIRDVEVLKSVKKEIDCLLGEGQYSQRTLQIAMTVKEHYGDGAIVNGDIIGQVGKCSLHRDIPLCFATPAYFRCKLHNYSKEAKKHLKFWMEEAKSSGECVNLFDLFSIENRMGRWAAQENLIYNSIGQLYLNIFNSRSIIYIWTAVNRKERKKASIHISLIEKKFPSLLKVPFESDSSIIIRLSKLNGLTYLFASNLKYWLGWLKYKRGD